MKMIFQVGRLVCFVGGTWMLFTSDTLNVVALIVTLVGVGMFLWD